MSNQSVRDKSGELGVCGLILEDISLLIIMARLANAQSCRAHVACISSTGPRGWRSNDSTRIRTA